MLTSSRFCLICDKAIKGRIFNCRTCEFDVFFCRNHFYNKGLYHPNDHLFREIEIDNEGNQRVVKKIEHTDHACDHCSVSPIVGIRFHCESCEESFDLCHKCYSHDFTKERKVFHPYHHVFRAITHQENLGHSIINPKLTNRRFIERTGNVGKTYFSTNECCGENCKKKKISTKRFYRCRSCKDYNLCRLCFKRCKRYHPKKHKFQLMYVSGNTTFLPVETIGIIVTFMRCSKTLRDLMIAYPRLQYYLQNEISNISRYVKFGYFQNPQRIINYVHRLVLVRSPRNVEYISTNFPNLKSLELVRSNLTTLPKIPGLEKLSICYCKEITKFFSNGVKELYECFPNLKSLKILCEYQYRTRFVPKAIVQEKIFVCSWIESFQSLEKLVLVGCSFINTREFETGLGKLGDNLKYLRVKKCPWWDLSTRGICCVKKLRNIVCLDLDEKARMNGSRANLADTFGGLMKLKYLVLGSISISGAATDDGTAIDDPKEAIIEACPHLGDAMIVILPPSPESFRRRRFVPLK